MRQRTFRWHIRSQHERVLHHHNSFGFPVYNRQQLQRFGLIVTTAAAAGDTVETLQRPRTEQTLGITTAHTFRATCTIHASTASNLMQSRKIATRATVVAVVATVFQWTIGGCASTRFLVNGRVGVDHGRSVDDKHMGS